MPAFQLSQLRFWRRKCPVERPRELRVRVTFIGTSRCIQPPLCEPQIVEQPLRLTRVGDAQGRNTEANTENVRVESGRDGS